jgi:Uma2 family endonuclease
MADTAHRKPLIEASGLSGPIDLGRRATLADVDAYPEGTNIELVDGNLYAQPSPRIIHRRVQFKMANALDGPFSMNPSGPGGWIFLFEPEIRIDETVLIPDIAGWRRDRFPPDMDANWISVPPDWLCEVMSPSTAARDRSVKAGVYAGWGAHYMWLIDPSLKTLEAYRNQSGQWLQLAVYKEGDEVKVEPFDAAPFKLDSLWT